MSTDKLVIRVGERKTTLLLYNIIAPMVHKHIFNIYPIQAIVFFLTSMYIPLNQIPLSWSVFIIILSQQAILIHQNKKTGYR